MQALNCGLRAPSSAGIGAVTDDWGKEKRPITNKNN